jgi:hypothetical protein
MQFDYIPPVIAIPLALILWLVVFAIWFRVPLTNKINDHFAHRRHIRRMRQRQQPTLVR